MSKAGDICGAIFDPGQFFYKPSTSKAKGADGAKDHKDVSQNFGPVTSLLAAVPGPVSAILGGVLGGQK